MPEYHFEEVVAKSGVTWQPDVYELADTLAKVRHMRTVVDVGCGSGLKLKELSVKNRVGVDYGPNLKWCRDQHDWGEWIEADFERESFQALEQFVGPSTLVVCADVVEHLVNPEHLVRFWRYAYEAGSVVITSTPDRVLVRGKAHRGPPENSAHVREWAKDEYVAYLVSRGLPVSAAGWTIDNDRDRQPTTIATIHDGATRALSPAFSAISSNTIAFENLRSFIVGLNTTHGAWPEDARSSWLEAYQFSDGPRRSVGVGEGSMAGERRGTRVSAKAQQAAQSIMDRFVLVTSDAEELRSKNRQMQVERDSLREELAEANVRATGANARAKQDVQEEVDRRAKEAAALELDCQRLAEQLNLSMANMEVAQKKITAMEEQQKHAFQLLAAEAEAVQTSHEQALELRQREMGALQDRLRLAKTEIEELKARRHQDLQQAAVEAEKMRVDHAQSLQHAHRGADAIQIELSAAQATILNLTQRQQALQEAAEQSEAARATHIDALELAQKGAKALQAELSTAQDKLVAQREQHQKELNRSTVEAEESLRAYSGALELAQGEVSALKEKLAKSLGDTVELSEQRQQELQRVSTELESLHRAQAKIVSLGEQRERDFQRVAAETEATRIAHVTSIEVMQKGAEVLQSKLLAAQAKIVELGEQREQHLQRAAVEIEATRIAHAVGIDALQKEAEALRFSLSTAQTKIVALGAQREDDLRRVAAETEAARIAHVTAIELMQKEAETLQDSLTSAEVAVLTLEAQWRSEQAESESARIALAHALESAQVHAESLAREMSPLRAEVARLSSTTNRLEDELVVAAQQRHSLEEQVHLSAVAAEDGMKQHAELSAHMRALSAEREALKLELKLAERAVLKLSVTDAQRVEMLSSLESRLVQASSEQASANAERTALQQRVSASEATLVAKDDELQALRTQYDVLQESNFRLREANEFYVAELDAISQQRDSLAGESQSQSVRLSYLAAEFEQLQNRSAVRDGEPAEYELLASKLEQLEIEQQKAEQTLHVMRERFENIPWRAVRVYRWSRKVIPGWALKLAATRIVRRPE